MNSFEQKIFNKIDRNLNHTEERLKLPIGFMKSLYDCTDWEFIIKSNAFLESSTNALLTDFLSKDFHRFIDNLDFANLKTGKLFLAKELGLIEKEHFNFIRSLCEERNVCAHTISNLNYDIMANISILNEKDQARWFKKYSMGFDIQDEFFSDIRIAIKYPKLFLITGIADILENFQHISEHHGMLQNKCLEEFYPIWWEYKQEYIERNKPNAHIAIYFDNPDGTPMTEPSLLYKLSRG